MRKLPSDMELLQKSCGTRVIYNGKSCITNITTKDMFDECLICSETKNQKIKDGIKYRPMDDNWKSRCKEDQFWFQDTLEDMKKLHPTMDDRLFDLRQKLLDFAGEAVCFPGYEEDLDNILNYGQFWIGNNIKLMRGEPSQCHANSCNLWEQNKDITRICTGYALSEDGMWRQHSWIIWHKARSNQIIETTVPRILYFGFVMTTDMCEEFADNNY